MPVTTVEDAFMKDLFADLDKTFLQQQILLSSPAKPASQTARTAIPQPRPPPVRNLHVNEIISTTRAQDPTPFWFKPIPKGSSSVNGSIAQNNLALSDKKPNFSSIGANPKKRSDEFSSPSRNLNSPSAKKPKQNDSHRPPTTRGIIRHTHITQDGKENANTTHALDKKIVAQPKLQIKEEIVDFDDLLQGVDWGDETEFDAPETQSRVAYDRSFMRCVIEDIQEVARQKELIVTSERFERTRSVILSDDWVSTQIEIGDTVNLIGPFDASSTPSLTITRQEGLLILHPDILVSSTKVADSSHCARKALLQEITRTLGGSTPSLVYGNMLHELMQSSMMESNWGDAWRKEKIEKIVRGQIANLWEIDLQVEKAQHELFEKSKQLEAFGRLFIGDKPKDDAFLSDLHSDDATRARLGIQESIAVEEDIWSPKFGLKGKIDISVRGTIAQGIHQVSGTLPFEIKTGRTNAGMEHRAQTMLYTLLMSDRYDENIDSGLLFYSQSNQVLRVKPARNEIRGLILARNEFASFLHRRMNLSNPDEFGPVSTQDDFGPTFTPKKKSGTTKSIEIGAEMSDDEADLWSQDDFQPSQPKIEPERALLPAPIDDYRSCKRCYVADACMLYRKAIDQQDEIVSNQDDPLQVMYDDKTSHLTAEHAQFFQHWERLISLEEQELVRFKKEIWTISSQERQKVGRCLPKMMIDHTFTPITQQDSVSAAKISRFTYRLHAQTALPSQLSSTQFAAKSLLGGSISVNDPIVISLEEPKDLLAISRGFVLELTAETILVGLDNSLTEIPQLNQQIGENKQFLFRIDKDELAAGMGRIRDNLIQLFVVGGDERRRRLIVDLQTPQFDAQIPRQQFAQDCPNLNSDQLDAVGKVLSMRDYSLILGMPGTGKTTTIAEVMKALAKQGKSILLTSYTHSAVDTILDKLEGTGLSILRLGNRDKIMPSLHRYTLDPDNPATSLAQLDEKFMMPQIVATTCLGINEPIFTKRKFDVCIVDEASQVTLPTCLGPLRFADKFVLVGDHNQLQPLVRNSAARKAGLDVSLFKRLSDAHPTALVYLTNQYRMNSEIMLLSNKLIYQDRLKVGNQIVANSRLNLPFFEQTKLSDWLKQIIRPDRPVLFVDTDRVPARERKIGSLIENELEAQLVEKTITALTSCGLSQSSVGVIAPYRQQIKLISRKLTSFPNVEILTADRSQGRDKDCIIMSLVRSNDFGQVGDLLKDWRRLNVCLTRAKSKLIVFGSRTTLANLSLLEKFFKVIDAEGWAYQLDKECLAELQAGGMGIKAEPRTPMKSNKAETRNRLGGGALALSRPLSQDILNSI